MSLPPSWQVHAQRQASRRRGVSPVDAADVLQLHRDGGLEAIYVVKTEPTRAVVLGILFGCPEPFGEAMNDA